MTNSDIPAYFVDATGYAGIIIVFCRRWGSNPYSFETDLNSVTFANSVTPAYSEYDTLHADFEKLGFWGYICTFVEFLHTLS